MAAPPDGELLTTTPERPRPGAVALLARRMGAYTFIQLAGFLAPFVALPIIARSTSSAGWASLGLGQAIGGMAGIIILYGWWTIGPAEYAKEKTSADRHVLYRRSLAERLLVSIPVLPISCIAAAAVASDGQELLAALSVLSLANLGFSPSWYFIAAASPARLALYETVPRVVASAGSAVLVAVSGEVLFYPILLTVLPVAAYAISLARDTPHPAGRKVWDWPIVKADVRRQVPVAGANILGGLYSQLMVPYVAVMVPGHLPAYVSGDRLYKAGRFTITAAGNTFQPWTLEQPTRRRHLAAIGGHGVLGVSGFFASWLLMPPVSRLMFGADLGVPSVLAAGLGAGFLFNSLLTPMIRNVLIPRGRRWVPLVATVFASAAGIVTVAVTRDLGGVALAVGLSEFVCCAISAAFTFPLLRTTS